VLLLAHHRARAFSEHQITLVGALLAHLARSIEMCDAVAAQTRIATALQESLLPPLLPVVEGVELAARYRPSGSGNLVGGDFYDVFPDRAGGWYLLLGDASAIGPEAAGLARVARYTARALADPAPPPGEILGQMNVALLRAASEGRFCTALLARFSRLAGSEQVVAVSLASSGHPRADVQRADGRVEPACEATGALLGVIDGAAVAEAELFLAPGDAAVFYTDGDIEARDNMGELFGEEGVVEVLTEATKRSAEGIARRLERAVLDHRAAGDRDDMAIVVVRVRPERPDQEGRVPAELIRL
jgi:serine phosphatase RsbU (regulator of sigma subunit)